MKFNHLGAIAILVFSIITFSILMLFELTLTNPKRTRFYYLRSQCKTSESASRLAKQCFEEGSCVLLEFGLPDNMVLSEVLESNYGVELIYGGCVGNTDEIKCYNETMYSLLQQKYGPAFYFQARNKAHHILSELNKAKPLY